MDFTSEVSDIDTVTKQAKVSIPSQILNQEVETELSSVAKTARIKGFRDGKAPIQMVEKLHGDKVRWDVVSRLVSKSLQDLLKKSEIQMVGDPKIDIISMEPGKDLEYTAEVSVYPSPEVKGYEKFTVKVVKKEVSSEDVNKVISQLLDSRATIRKVEGREKVKEGDVIDATLSVAVEGEDPSAPEPVVVGLGEGRLPEELENGILGMKIGESRTIEGKISDQYPEKNAAGKAATYSVTLNGISEKVLPELTDDLVQTLGFESKTALELRVEISKKLEQNAERDAKADAKARVLDQLLEGNDFQVPQILVDDEIRNLLVRAGVANLEKMKFQQIPAEPFREQFGEMGAKRVRTSIIVDRIAALEKISPTEEDMKAAMGEWAGQYGVTEADARKLLNDRNALMNFAIDVTRNKVLDFLLERTKINYIDKEEEAPAEEEKGTKKKKKK